MVVFFYEAFPVDFEAFDCLAVFFPEDTLCYFLAFGVLTSFLTFFGAGGKAAAFFGAFLICLVFFSAFLAGFIVTFEVYLGLETDFSLLTAGFVSSTLTDSTGADFEAAGLAFSDNFA